MPFIIDVASAVVHRLIGAAFVQASPFTDVLVAWDMEGGTVLYDLDQDTAVQILPVQARVHRWLDGSRVLVTVEGSGDSAASPWVTGVYEIDLAGMTASLLSTVSPRSGELSPAGDRWLSVTQQTGKWAVQVRDVDGTNVRNVYETLGERQPTVRWSPNNTDIFVYDDGAVLAVDEAAGPPRPLFEVPEEWRGGGGAQATWSSDARYLAVGSGNDANEFAMWIVDLQSASVSPEPYRGITPGPWQPSGSLMLGLSDVCVANGFAPVFIEAASGQMWRVESAQNIWYQAWSSDGASALSGSHATLYRLAPRSETAELLLSFDTLRDDTDDVPRSLTWSATGRWITGDAESGRGRC